METKRIHSFLNSYDNFNFHFESDLDRVSWKNSENIIVDRIQKLENSLYTNTKSNHSFDITGDVAFYFLPYLELIINNFPYLKIISTKKSKKNTFIDIMNDIKTNNSLFSRLFMFKKKYKNHWINHNGSNWEKDYILDKCYPKFKATNLEDSIHKYIEMYIAELKILQKRYPNNIKIFFSDELESKYGKKKMLSFIGV
tara:strand:+ start:99 stop:692 length:594 start_codon:yes stop_codon:yes gene_type:complete